ncbi:hypothetical protein QQ056_10750 [Oscillatoria laete-virens NRMC-F 0139]|nr:hypothetical protein [Oscillatoria laete-virens]MDL5054019.1 hypothetical protein [Oscillatoria laete-virens NRMC-F 0139]
MVIASSKIIPPEIRFVTFEWTVRDWSCAKVKPSIRQCVEIIKKAGFQVVAPWPSGEVLEATVDLGMERLSYVDANDKTYAEALQKALSMKPSRVNVQLWDHDTLPKVAVETWIKMERLAEKLGLAPDLEVHRDTCTETPEKTYEIADLYHKKTGRKLRFCFDFSHFAVVKHLSAPFAPRLLDHPDLVQLARQIHFRAFNGHHCQVPVIDSKGRLTPEGRDYLDFADELLKCWFGGAKGGEVLYVNPEQLPIVSGYGLTGFQENLWEEVKFLRDELHKLWDKNLTQWKRAQIERLSKNRR